ncbi:MAG: hypothetical protein QM763_20215 [Agriterribacter sp.]
MNLPFDINFPASILLRTKNLTCWYEEGRLRHVKGDNTEIVRMIYGAVRDTNWGTVAFTIADEHIRQEEDSFTITYTAHYRQDDIVYEAICRIEGGTDDTITFQMNGKALTRFNTCRIGLCVHLPVKERISIPVTVIHPSGERTASCFPENISPHQPFSEIEQLQWTTGNNTTIQLHFSGDVFEAEDQRNWMDHSYKIYSRPLALPFPFEVNVNDTMKQSICLSVAVTENKADAVVKAPDIETAKIPAIGIAAADESVLLTTREIEALQALPLLHYRAELDFEKDWQFLFTIHCTNAKAIGTALELVLFLTDNYRDEIKDFVTTVSYGQYNIKSILPQHKAHKVTPLFLLEYCYPLLKRSFPSVMVGYGTDIYFAELNRQRPQHDGFDFISFSLNPQVHSFDEKTMLENIETIPDIIRTIRSFTAKPIFVSPVTFKKRKNHDGTGDTRHTLVNNFDARQNTWFGAGWFLLCLYALRNMQQVSFFKTTGDSGIISRHETTPLFRVLERLKTFNATGIRKKNTGDTTQIIFRNEADEELVFDIAGY